MVRSILTVPAQRIEGGSAAGFQDLVAVEEPLEIRVNGRSVSITMRTPGHDFELAAGFLFTEGIVESREQIATLRHADAPPGSRQAGNVVEVELAGGLEFDETRLDRHFYMTSSCGVCGKASIEALESRACPVLTRESPLVNRDVISSLPATLRAAQPVFERTGGLHAAALFTPHGELASLREDVGRHNAVDKLAGSEMLAVRTPCFDRVLLVSGRTSFELVQKTLAAGIPVLAAIGAPSSLAVETALRFNLTLIGFLREGRFNVYSGRERIV